MRSVIHPSSTVGIHPSPPSPTKPCQETGKNFSATVMFIWKQPFSTPFAASH